MASVAIHPPKTPVTKGSHTIAKATIPNVCKMPGPPAPFVPTPLPNIGKSEMSPQGYSTTVKIEGNAVAIRGASFKSLGDIASKGTGGGLVSANAHGVTKFIMPGSMTVKAQGKGIHLLSEPMLNNCGPSGSPPNTGATMQGVVHASANVGGDNPFPIKCKDAPHSSDSKFTDCQTEEICAKCEEVNKQAQAGVLKRPGPTAYAMNRADGDYKCSALNKAARAGKPADLGFHNVSDDCKKKLKKEAEDTNYESVSADHVHEIQLGGHPGHPFPCDGNLKWMSRRSNSWIGGVLQNYDPDVHTGVKPDCC